MDLSLRDMGKFKGIDVSGDIDFKNGEMLKTTVDDLLKHGHSHIIISVSNVTSTFSYFISILVQTWRVVAASQGSIGIVTPEPRIMEMLKMNNVGQLMPLFSSEDCLKEEADNRRAEPQRFATRDHGRWKVVSIAKSITVISGFSELAKEMDHLVENGHTNIALDFSRIDHVYSEVAGLMAKMRKVTEDLGGEFCVVCPSPSLKERICLMGIGEILPIYRTIREIKE